MAYECEMETPSVSPLTRSNRSSQSDSELIFPFIQRLCGSGCWTGLSARTAELVLSVPIFSWTV